MINVVRDAPLHRWMQREFSTSIESVIAQTHAPFLHRFCWYILLPPTQVVRPPPCLKHWRSSRQTLFSKTVEPKMTWKNNRPKEPLLKSSNQMFCRALEDTDAFKKKGDMGMDMMWLFLEIIPSVTRKGQGVTFPGELILLQCFRLPEELHGHSWRLGVFAKWLTIESATPIDFSSVQDMGARGNLCWCHSFFP